MGGYGGGSILGEEYGRGGREGVDEGRGVCRERASHGSDATDSYQDLVEFLERMILPFAASLRTNSRNLK